MLGESGNADLGSISQRHNMRKDVHVKRHKCTNSQREYVRGIVHNLSFQRWTDKDIAKFLNEEKKIEVSRSTVSRIRNEVERTAEKWYIELKKSAYKYIATYKERLDSLYYYQKKLHEIINSTNKDEVKIRALLRLIQLKCQYSVYGSNYLTYK